MPRPDKMRHYLNMVYGENYENSDFKRLTEKKRRYRRVD